MGRTEWKRGVEQDRAVLEHIRVLLLALATLVDRAAGLPAVDRLHVLAILGHGEVEARSFIVAMASGAPAGIITARPATGDAGQLAASFRMLALVLGAVLMQARTDCRHASPPAGLPGCKPHRSAPRIPSSVPRATSPPARGVQVGWASASRHRVSSLQGGGDVAREAWRRRGAFRGEAGLRRFPSQYPA